MVESNKQEISQLKSNFCNQLKVPIRTQDKKSIPFGTLYARNVVAEIFSYVEYKNEVSDIMQSCSHLTRAYFINADLLKGFLIVKPYCLEGIAAFTVISNRMQSRAQSAQCIDADFLVDAFCYDVIDYFETEMIELQSQNKAELKFIREGLNKAELEFMREGLDEEDEELRFGDLICTLEPPPDADMWYYQ